MEDTIFIQDNPEYLDTQSINLKYKPTIKKNQIFIYILLILIIVQNVCIFIFIIKIKNFAKSLDLGWLGSEELMEYKKRVEMIIDQVCKLYIKCY